MPNRLAQAKSPYLLQHKDNPVDWYEWGEDAFARARAEAKPIFLSVGYSTCHWCHVMERESFENEALARLLNEHFVSIKVDREERPDVDRVYMAFVQATTGGGGWPMSVFLTPELKPFFGGTYFPPDDKYGRPGFGSLLGKIDELWRTQRARLEESGARVIDEMRRAEEPDEPALLGPEVFETAAQFFAQNFDPEHAGFGRAPKFPRPVVHDFLLRRFARAGDADSAKRVLATLHMMSRGGMYDQLGGGFHRYSVDRFWHVPHFEKMLYDQAQLVVSLVEAYQVKRDPFFARIARETIAYVLRDLTDTGGGFYSAEDADSLPPGAGPGAHKIEGAFYVWTRDEIAAALDDEAGAALFSAFYAVEPDGNADDPHGELTGKNVLHAVGDPAKIDEPQLVAARAKLFELRAKRPRPHRDEKIITSWNGMMISALARAYQVLGDPAWLEAATRAARFVAENLWLPGETRLLRRFAAGQAGIDAYLDDHAQLAGALVDLYEAGFDTRWLVLAETIADQMVARFHDAKDGGFFATSGSDPSLLLRMKDDYDGAEPSGSSIAARTLLRLAEMLDRDDLRQVAEGTFRASSQRLRVAPHVLPELACALDFSWDPPAQVVIAGERDGEDTRALLDAVRRPFAPRKTVLLADAQARAELGARLPWLAAMAPVEGRAAAYVCRNHACERPTGNAADVIDLLPHAEIP